MPVLHAANFALPVHRADYGGGVVEQMRPQDIFVAVLEFDRASATTALFARPRPRHLLIETFGPDRLQRGREPQDRSLHNRVSPSVNMTRRAEPCAGESVLD